MTFHYIFLTQVCLKYIFGERQKRSRYSKDYKISFKCVLLRIISFVFCANILHTPRNLTWWQKAV